MSELKFSREFQQQTGPRGESISQFKDKSFEIILSEEQKEKGMKINEGSLWSLGAPLREIIYASLESQKNKRGRKG